MIADWMGVRDENWRQKEGLCMAHAMESRGSEKQSGFDGCTRWNRAVGGVWQRDNLRANWDES